MHNWQFFDRITCLTLGGDEWTQAQAEFNAVSIPVKPFHALKAIGPHESFNLSTYAILKEFYDSKDQTLLFLEDDCDFRNLHLLPQVLKELPKDFDIFYLGGNLQDERPQRVGKYIFKVTGCWTTHAVVYRKSIVKYILDHHPGESDLMYDTWLSTQLHLFKAYMVAPMLAYQRPRVSSIWGGVQNYHSIFESSENRLMACR
jgi:hypothetical protein